jgi:WD40 repeat protein
MIGARRMHYVTAAWLVAICSNATLVRAGNPPDITLSGHSGPVLAVAVSPDDANIVSVGDDGRLKIWDIAGQKELFSVDGARSNVNCIRITPDGGFAVALGADNNLLIVEIKTGKSRSIALDNQAGGAGSLDLSPDGKRIAVSGRSSLRLIDFVNGTVKATFEVHKSYDVPAVAFSADGLQLATAGTDNTAELIDAATGKVLHTFKLRLNGMAVAISRDGKSLYVSASDQTLQCFDVETGAAKTLVDKNVPILSLAVSADGKTLVLGGPAHGPWLVAVADGTVIDGAYDSDNWVKSAAISKDSKWLVGGANSGDVYLWKMAK